MYDWADFDTVFRNKSDFALDQKQVEFISRQRKDVGGILFFDRICTSIGLKQASKSYPPKSNSDLRALWTKITATPISAEMKQAVLFYLLRDCKQPNSISNNIDASFARKSYLPHKYQLLVTGLWDLDHAHYIRALDSLTDPLLSTGEFADDILLTLLTASRCDDALAVNYYLSVSPPLKKKETLEAYFELLVRTSISEAYRFARKHDADTHAGLFKDMLTSVLEEEPSSQKADRMIQVIGLPFSDDEHRIFEEYLLRGDAARITGAKDAVIMRRVALGQSFEGVGTLDRYRGTKVDGVNWDDVRLLYQSAVPSAAST